MPADPTVCGVQLRALIQKQCDAYHAEAERLQKECDAPELARMLREAEFLSDADSKRWQRCHAEQRISFLRSEAALYKALDRDREEAGDDGNYDPGPAGRGGSGENQGREEEAATAECAGPAACGPPGGDSAGRSDGPHPPCKTLSQGERVFYRANPEMRRNLRCK
jgi:hypothetical protein